MNPRITIYAVLNIWDDLVIVTATEGRSKEEYEQLKKLVKDASRIVGYIETTRDSLFPQQNEDRPLP